MGATLWEHKREKEGAFDQTLNLSKWGFKVKYFVVQAMRQCSLGLIHQRPSQWQPTKKAQIETKNEEDHCLCSLTWFHLYVQLRCVVDVKRHNRLVENRKKRHRYSPALHFDTKLHWNMCRCSRKHADRFMAVRWKPYIFRRWMCLTLQVH